jgi:hypothetical protein
MSRRGTVLIAALVLILAVGVGIRLFAGVGTDDRTGPTPDPVASPGPPRTEPLWVQLPLNPAELSPARLTEALDQAARAGATDISAGVTWWFITQGRSPDEYDWSAIDRLVDGARARTLEVRLQLSGTPDAVHPDVASAVPGLDDRIWYPPRTDGELHEWAAFVRATVTHFKGRVASYEMWNEPNIVEFWKPRPDPAEYAALLESGYTAAKQVDPGADVVFGGLSHNDVSYLQAYYRAAGVGAAVHRWYFDTLDVHPYTDGRSPDDTSPDTATLGRYGPVDKSFAGLKLMKAAMDRHEGATGKSIVIGEYGFTTTGTDTAGAVDDQHRAYFLKRAFAIADKLSYIEGISWYGFLPDSSNGPGWAIASPGAYGSWTLRALRDVAAAKTAPAVALPRDIHPGVDVRISVAGNPAITQTELWVDGRLRAEDAGTTVRWPREKLAAGRVQVAAYSADGHVWPSPVITVSTGN